MGVFSSLRKISQRWNMSVAVQPSTALTVPQLLQARAQAMPEHVPLQVLAGAGLSYQAWLDQSDAAAASLYQAGARCGTRIALLFDGLDWLDYAVGYMAVLRCGATAIHMNGHMPEAETMRRLAECECSWIIRSSFLPKPHGFLGKSATVAELLRGSAPLPDITIEPSSIAEIRYTSGTTGPAKGYLVSHDNLTHGRSLDAMRELSNASSMLVPMTLGTSTSATLLVIGAGSPVQMVLCSPLDIETMGELIEMQAISAFMITPHIAQEVVESRLGERYNLSSVKLVASASSPLSPGMASALLAMMPAAKLQIACAQSEASPALLTQTYDPERPFSVGKPSSNTEVRIIGADHRDAPVGELGELWLRTPAPKRLFLSAPETNAKLLEDGWYRTGDLGRMDSAGYIEFFDRKVDALLRDGQLISSIHLEASMLEQAAVREAAVVTIGTGTDDSKIVAFVVLREPNALGGLKQGLAFVIPKEHFPDAFVVLSSLPRTQNGKVLKRELRLNVGIR